MSTNCLRCVRRERTGADLLCDQCRATAFKINDEILKMQDDARKGGVTALAVVRLDDLSNVLIREAQTIDFANEHQTRSEMEYDKGCACEAELAKVKEENRVMRQTCKNALEALTEERSPGFKHDVAYALMVAVGIKKKV